MTPTTQHKENRKHKCTVTQHRQRKEHRNETTTTKPIKQKQKNTTQNANDLNTSRILDWVSSRQLT